MNPVERFIVFYLLLHQSDGLNNAGKTFFQTFNFNQPTVEDHVLHAFILSTESAQCNITITIDRPPLTTYTVPLTSTKAMVHTVDAKSTRGIKLSAPCDFVVYGLNFATQSADGWMAIPVESLGDEYVILGVEPWLEEEPTQLSLVGTVDNTSCTCTFPNGTEHSSHLNAIQVDYITSEVDLTGTRVKCSEKVTVITGQRCSNFPKGCIACDHTVEQVAPKSTLGRNFAMVPLLHSCKAAPTCCDDPKFCQSCIEIYRLLAVENDTECSLLGDTNDTFSLNAGESRYILLKQTEFAHLSTTKPVILGQYFNGQGYEGQDQDPAFAIIPQIESYSDRYQAATCFPQFKSHFVNLVVHKNSSNNLLLNGVPFLNSTSGHDIPGTEFEAFQYKFDCSKSPTEPISFTITHSQNLTFGLFAYGFSYYISYGYPGGMNLNEDVFYKCAPPQLNLTGQPSFWMEACNLSDANPDFKTPTHWTDEQCCGGAGNLTYEDNVISSTNCRKQIARTWTLEDGCGRTVEANQTAIIDQAFDSYNEPPKEATDEGECDSVSNRTGLAEKERDCGTTSGLNFTDVRVNETTIKRQWSIQQDCTNEFFKYTVTIHCENRSVHETTPTEVLDTVSPSDIVQIVSATTQSMPSAVPSVASSEAPSPPSTPDMTEPMQTDHMEYQVTDTTTFPTESASSTEESISMSTEGVTQESPTDETSATATVTSSLSSTETLPDSTALISDESPPTETSSIIARTVLSYIIVPGYPNSVSSSEGTPLISVQSNSTATPTDSAPPLTDTSPSPPNVLIYTEFLPDSTGSVQVSGPSSTHPPTTVASNVTEFTTIVETTNEHTIVVNSTSVGNTPIIGPGGNASDPTTDYPATNQSTEVAVTTEVPTATSPEETAVTEEATTKGIDTNVTVLATMSTVVTADTTIGTQSGTEATTGQEQTSLTDHTVTADVGTTGLSTASLLTTVSPDSSLTSHAVTTPDFAPVTTSHTDLPFTEGNATGGAGANTTVVTTPSTATPAVNTTLFTVGTQSSGDTAASVVTAGHTEASGQTTAEGTPANPPNATAQITQQPPASSTANVSALTTGLKEEATTLESTRGFSAVTALANGSTETPLLNSTLSSAMTLPSTPSTLPSQITLPTALLQRISANAPGSTPSTTSNSSVFIEAVLTTTAGSTSAASNTTLSTGTAVTAVTTGQPAKKHPCECPCHCGCRHKHRRHSKRHHKHKHDCGHSESGDSSSSSSSSSSESDSRDRSGDQDYDNHHNHSKGGC